MRLDIFSDLVCPWCFIGKRRLARALSMRQLSDINVHWRAFQLNPQLSSDGMDQGAYIRAKFGGPDRARDFFSTIEQVGRSESIAFAFERIYRVPNTVQAHRLLGLAGSRGLQDEMAEQLFSAYFIEGRDIGSCDELGEIAFNVGLDSDMVSRFLNSDDERDRVLAEDSFARRIGISGVPSFVFNGQHILSGAQAPEVMLQVFDLARQESREASAVTTI